MYKIVIIFVSVLLLNVFSGCEQVRQIFPQFFKSKDTATVVKDRKEEARPAVKGTTLATVNNHVITLEEFEENVRNLRALSEEINLDTFEAKRELLNELISHELLYEEAKARGIQNREEVKKAVESYTRGAMIQQLVLDATENVTIEAQEIESFYNEYKNQFADPEQRKVSEIVVSSEDQARQILIRLLQGEDFAVIARERSISASRQAGGDLGFIQRGDKFQKFDEIAFSLDRGVASSVFKGPDGHYVVRVEQIREGKPKLLTEVWDPIRETLLALKQQQRLESLTERLRREAKISINDNLLKFGN